jgi:hypothetical protein
MPSSHSLHAYLHFWFQVHISHSLHFIPLHAPSALTHGYTYSPSVPTAGMYFPRLPQSTCKMNVPLARPHSSCPIKRNEAIHTLSRPQESNTLIYHYPTRSRPSSRSLVSRPCWTNGAQSPEALANTATYSMGVCAASNSGRPTGCYSFQTFPKRRTGLVASFASELIWGSTGTCITLCDPDSSNLAAGFLTYVATLRHHIPHVRHLSRFATYHQGTGMSH